jgi:hypothetical protein
MKKIFTFGVMMLGLFATTVQAETKHCHTIEDCRKQIAERNADLAELLKNVTPELTGILKTRVTWQQAKDVCDNHKDTNGNNDYRLPTARELAQVSQSLGAQGIIEVKDVSEKDKENGYYLLKGSDSEGNSDHFYFSHKGYERPAGDLGIKWFWSSSVHPHFSNSAYSLYGVWGHVDYVGRSVDSNSAVRCVRSR